MTQSRTGSSSPESCGPSSSRFASSLIASDPALRLFLLFSFLRTKVCLNLGAAFVPCPLGRRGLPQSILPIQSCSAFHQKPDHVQVAADCGPVQWCGVGMSAERVVPVRILARVKQHPHNLKMTELRRQRECPVAILSVGIRKQATGFLNA